MTILARIVPDELSELEHVLGEVRENLAGNPVIPFGQFDNIHFARLVIVPESIDSRGTPIPPTLVFATNFDGSVKDHLNLLVSVAELDRIFDHCQGYPDPNCRTAETRLAYLKRSTVKTNTLYVNTVGRSVRQVEQEAMLRERIQRFLDQGDFSSHDPGQVHRRIQRFVAGDPDVKWALAPPESGLGLRIRKMLKVGVAVIVALALLGVMFLLPLLFLIPLSMLLILRFHEVWNRPQNIRPPNERLKENESIEDFQVQNQLSAIGFLQKGLFRRTLTRIVLHLLAFGARNIFYRGHLSGVDTIHFARWVMIDGGQRVFFFSNYDGSLDSYNDDFIDRVPAGLNLVFSNGRGWPRTLFLLFKGARDEQGFKFYLRNAQIPTQVWYSAPGYKGMTAVNLERNTKIRAGLAASLSGAKAEEWLRLF